MLKAQKPRFPHSQRTAATVAVYKTNSYRTDGDISNALRQVFAFLLTVCVTERKIPTTSPKSNSTN